jgi:hypothetical protein
MWRKLGPYFFCYQFIEFCWVMLDIKHTDEQLTTAGILGVYAVHCVRYTNNGQVTEN